MQRITITIDDDLMHGLDQLIKNRGYQNRSEAIRDLARAGLAQARQDTGEGECVSALVYVYEHSKRQLANRLVHSFHEHHDLALATLHVHLDHENCMEVTVLKGGNRDVQEVADQVIAERGVRYGRLLTIPAGIAREVHAHGKEVPQRHSHIHVRSRR